MSELSPDARDLIAQARRQGSDLLGPSAGQRAQLRERLTPLWAASATPPRVSIGLRWKLGSLALLAGLGLMGWMFTPSADETALISPLEAAAKSAHAAVARVAQSDSTVGPVTRVTELQMPCESGAGLACQPPSAAVGQSTRPELSAAELASQTIPLTAAARKSKRLELSASEAAQSLPAKVRESQRPELSVSEAAQSLPAKMRESKRSELSASGPAAQSLPAKMRESTDSAASAPEPDLLAAIGLSEPGPLAQAKTHRSRRPPAAAVPAARLPLRATEDRTPEAPVRTDPDPAPPSIDGELELLGAAQTALQKQRPTRALSLLQEHAFRFPTGAMVEERMAMQALALCALQRRHAAQTVLSNLAARGAPSQLLPRVRSQCGL